MRLMKMFSLLIVGAMMWACDALFSVQPLSITPSEFDIIESKGATLSFAVSAPSSWTIECTADWIVADPSSGQGAKDSEPVFLHVSENLTPRQRIGVVTVICGDQKKTIIITQSGDSSQGDTDPDPTPGQGTQATTIGQITQDGIYMVQGTVVACANEAYVLADDSGAIVVYGSNHGRSLMEVVKVEGAVNRYQGYATNAFQLKATSTSLVSTGAQWQYSPLNLDASSFDALVGKTASCIDVRFEGVLTIDGTYVNVRPDGATRTSSFKHVTHQDYVSLAGETVVVSAFVVGTNNYLYVLPYDVAVKEKAWEVCGTNTGWVDGIEMEKVGNMWVAYNIPFKSGSDHEFKLRLGKDWADGEFGYDGSSEVYMTSNTYCSVVSTGNVGNIPVAAGTYDIWLDPVAQKVYVMKPGDNVAVATQAGSKPALPDGCVAISSIVSAGDYTVQGTVVAVAMKAYIVADYSGALMVYGTGHNRSVGDIVKLTGAVSRYRDDVRNVLQMNNAVVQLISTGATWSYGPEQIDGYDMNGMVNNTASCREVSLTGVLARSGSYLNFNIEGAVYQATFYYIDNELYSDISNGSTVSFKGYVVGTETYLKIIPYEVTMVSGPTVDVPKDSDPRGKKWMELPATNTSGLGYYYHSFSMNGKTYRNYSFGWDDSNKVAIWVAYPLSKLYTDSYNGKNNRHEEYFIQDPLLGNTSPMPGGGYAGDYDRGHQIPSADRQCSELANGQTYYGTNMTAQSNPLNGGPWAQLEGYVRDFAKSSSDTTYVVTGCYVKDSSEWETDSYGMRIKVPTAYYKAVLVLKNNTWTGGAYWTPHVGYSSSYTGWAISIDELENKIGVDLYVNLPEKIGESAAAAIEAARPGDSKWWR